MKTAADKAIDERQKLGRIYRAMQKKAFEDACARPGQLGERVAAFARSLRRFTIDDAEEMVAAVTRECDTWLRGAPEDIRALMLGLVDKRIIAIREGADMVPFDDPLEWQDENVFLQCKRSLGL